MPNWMNGGWKPIGVYFGKAKASSSAWPGTKKVQTWLVIDENPIKLCCLEGNQ